MSSGIRNAIDRSWDRLWSDGVTNPIRAIEVIALTLLASRLRAGAPFELRQPSNSTADAKRVLDALGISLTEAASQVRDDTYAAIERDLEKFSVLPDAPGDALEYALSYLSSAGRFGQFRTPSHIISFMVRCLPIDEGAIVLDPSAGTGGFLTASIAEHPTLHLQVIGDEIDASMSEIANANLALRGFPRTVIRRDALDGLGRTADIVLANPPFSGRINVEHNIPTEVASTRTEVLFTDLITKRVRDGGWAAFIVPISVLTNTDRGTVAARRLLHRDGTLRAIVELPLGTFRPYTDVRTAILFWNKQVTDDATQMWRITADGFSLDDKRIPIPEDDLPVIQAAVARLLRGGRYSKVAPVVPRHELENGARSHLPSRYLKEEASLVDYGSFDELLASASREAANIAALLGGLR